MMEMKGILLGDTAVPLGTVLLAEAGMIPPHSGILTAPRAWQGGHVLLGKGGSGD